MRITYEQADKPRRHHGIKCLTCQKILGTKTELSKRHKGHEVVYLKADGSVDD